MDFLSGAGQLKLVIRPASTSFDKTPDGRKVPVVDMGLRVKFRALAEPIPTDAFTAKDGLARGVLNTKHAVRHLNGMDEDELINTLLNHPKHGLLFGRVGGHNESITPDMLHIVPMSDGHYCTLCKKSLAKQGVHNHPKSKEHQKHLAAIEQDAREAIAG